MDESTPIQNQVPVQVKNKYIAGILAIFLGTLGFHRFYIGRMDGVFYIILSLLLLWPFVAIVSVYQGIKYLVISEQTWKNLLVQSQSGVAKKRTKIRMTILTVLLLLSFTALIVFLMYKENKAKADAESFCASVNIGDPAEPLKERASNTGVRILRTINDNKIEIGFIGIPPFSRHICIIDLENGKITAKNYFYLD